MPKGMCGDLVLPKSSCDACSAITSDAERIVLRGVFDHLRSYWGISGRRKSKRPDSYPIKIGPKRRGVNLTLNAIPGHSWYLPALGLPGVFCTDDNPHQPWGNLTTRFDYNDVVRIRSLGRGQDVGFSLGAVGINVFALMLAKIAYSYAYAVYGPANFSSALPSIIRGDHADLPYWVGEWPETFPAVNHLYSIDLGEQGLTGGDTYVCVRIRFFSWLNTPSFLVVVGKPSFGFIYSGAGSYAKEIEFQ